jgi:hypothetical protein
MQKLIAEGHLAALFVVNVCGDPTAAMAYIQQQWTLTGKNPISFRSLITSVSRSAAFAKFLGKNKSASSSRKHSRGSRREERFHSDDESDEDDDKYTGAKNRDRSKNQKGKGAKRYKGGKGGGGGGAATKP